MERSASALNRLKRTNEQRFWDKFHGEKVLLAVAKAFKSAYKRRLHLQETLNARKDAEASELKTTMTKAGLLENQLRDEVKKNEGLKKALEEKEEENTRLRLNTCGDESVIRTLAIPLTDGPSIIEAEDKIANLLAPDETTKRNEVLMRSWRKDGLVLQLGELLNRFQDPSAEDLDALRSALDDLRKAAQAAKV